MPKVMASRSKRYCTAVLFTPDKSVTLGVKLLNNGLLVLTIVDTKQPITKQLIHREFSRSLAYDD